MNTHRDDHEEALDRLLTSLGSVKVDAGFEQRVLRGVEAHQAPTPAQRSPRLLWTFGLASAVAAALIGAAVMLHSGRRSGSQPAIARGELPKVPQPEVAQAVSHAARVPGRMRGAAPRKDAESSPNRGSTMLASFPAPEAPLTEQERLLLRIAHTGDPVEFAALNPERRASVEAADEAEYLKFFPPPPPIDDEQDQTNQTVMKEKGDAR
jgi:hypothetical protein